MRSEPNGTRKMEEKIRRKNFTVLVVGTGRIGLPLCVAFANAGVSKVLACDKDENLIRTVKAGKSPFREEDLEHGIRKALSMGNLELTSRASQAASKSDVVVICVGTPLTSDNRADASYVIGAIDEVCPFMRDGTLLVFRSTLSPGMMRSLVLPHIRHRTNRRIGVLFCPERIVEGKALSELRKLPEIIGGEDNDSIAAGRALFSLLGRKRILVTDYTTAETAKVYSNIYRYVNFALANEFAVLAEDLGVNARNAIQIANAGYKRGGIPAPGPAGGPCLYKDGHFLISRIPYVDFIRTAWHFNESVPEHVVAKLRKTNGGLYDRTVGVLGLSYKRDSDDLRYSPAVKLVESLKSEGARVKAHDPFVKSADSLESVLKCEIVVIACNHSAYSELKWSAFKGKYVYDCWGLLSRFKKKFEASGITYREFGEG